MSSADRPRLPSRRALPAVALVVPQVMVAINDAMTVHDAALQARGPAAREEMPPRKLPAWDQSSVDNDLSAILALIDDFVEHGVGFIDSSDGTKPYTEERFAV